MVRFYYIPAEEDYPKRLRAMLRKEPSEELLDKVAARAERLERLGKSEDLIAMHYAAAAAIAWSLAAERFHGFEFRDAVAMMRRSREYHGKALIRF